MRRKKNYRRTLESLLRDILRLREYPSTTPAGELPLNELTERLRYALENDEDEDAKQMEMGDDFIISGGNMQIIGREQEKSPLPALEEPSLQREELGMQTEDDPKPFLAFLLSNQNL